MLFLAVFCGFLAENQREHMIGHNRAKFGLAKAETEMKEAARELILLIKQEYKIK